MPVTAGQPRRLRRLGPDATDRAAVGERPSAARASPARLRQAALAPRSTGSPCKGPGAQSSACWPEPARADRPRPGATQRAGLDRAWQALRKAPRARPPAGPPGCGLTREPPSYYLRSLHQFMFDKHLDLATRCDANPPSVMDVSVKTTRGDLVSYRLLSLPPYLPWALADVVAAVTASRRTRCARRPTPRFVHRLRGCRLGQAAPLDDGANLTGQLRLRHRLRRPRVAEVREDVPAADHIFLLRHRLHSLASLISRATLRRRLMSSIFSTGVAMPRLDFF